MIFNHVEPSRKVAYDDLLQVIFIFLAVAEILLFDVSKSFVFTILVYGSTIVAGFLIISLGTISYYRSNLPTIIKLALFLYAAIILYYTASWMYHGTDPILRLFSTNRYVTIFANPNLSVTSWLCILMVPLASIRLKDKCIFPSAPKTLGYGFLVLAVLTPIRFIFGILSLAPIYVVIILAALSCDRKDVKPYIVIGALLLLVGVILVNGINTEAAGNRSYAIAAIFAMMIYPIKNMRKPITALLFVTVLSAIFIFAIFGREVLGLLGGVTGGTIFRDTRTFLIVELFTQLSVPDLIIGRGLDGVYYSDMMFYQMFINYSSNFDFPFRPQSEVGLLNMILKLGFVGLFLFLFVVGSALFVRKKNDDASAIDNAMITGCRKMILVFTLLFSTELHNQIGIMYGIWYACSGILYSHAFASRSRPKLADIPLGQPDLTKQ